MKIVDITNPIPKYLQISAWLRELVQAGRYKPGEKLPSEVELSKICGVNRNTLRQAISELVTVGLIRKVKGTGTFVAAAAPVELRHKLEHILSFAELMRDSGIKEETRILGKGAETAGEKVTEALFLGSGERVVAVRRVRIGDRIPYIYEESYLPYNRFKAILEMDLTGSMYRLYSEHFHVILARCKQTISAVNLDEEIAAILELPENAAGIFLENITFDENSLPVEVLHTYHRGDKYKLEIELGGYHHRSDKIVHFTAK